MLGYITRSLLVGLKQKSVVIPRQVKIGSITAISTYILKKNRQCAIAYRDFWQAYKTVIPVSRHRPVLKSSGQTNHIERLIRQAKGKRQQGCGRAAFNYRNRQQNLQLNYKGSSSVHPMY